MKIEICEQMIQSWLLNCELCEVVQTNWTISPLRNISTAEINAIADLMLDIQDELNTKLEIDYKTALQYNIERDLSEKCDISSNEEVPQLRLPDIRKIKTLNIFKKSTASQFIRQCEIDVVGIKLNDGNTESIYLVDSAFHKGGLGYHDVVATVLKKLIRAILVSAIIFGTKSKINVIFAAPKCGKNLEQDLLFFVNSLKNIPIIKNNYPNIIIDLYFNETFSEKIYLPMKKETDELNNDNDLFMRSMNLAKVSEENLPPSATNTNISSNSKTGKSPNVSSQPNKRQNNKEVVFDILQQIIDNGKINNVLSDLQTNAYTKANFKLSTYPFLIKETDFTTYGYSEKKFYTKRIEINSQKYMVCSQLSPEGVTLFQEWFNKL